MTKRSLSVTTTALFTALTAWGAYIYIPIPLSPVPITGQTLFVYLSGALLGGRRGALSQALYILLGCMGLPIFAGGRAGYLVLLGPTGGYLVGFVLCSFTVGFLVKVGDRLSNGRLKLAWYLASMVIATLIIYALGVLQLCYWLGGDLIKAVAVGILPFLAGDAFKVVLAAILTVKVRPLVLAMISR